jgi:pimeloyl-ACP methyl ester carboxylesterase
MRLKSVLRRVLPPVVGGSALLAAGWVGYSRMFVAHNLALPPALPAERKEVTARAGRLNYYVAGSGRPLLLIHSINAAGSAYEVRPIFERMSASRRVYAVDLPGFGFSDRSPRDYRVALYVDAILDMLDVIAQDSGSEPLDAVALSLSSEFLARAALSHPDRFATLALVTPTGFSRLSAVNASQTPGTREIPGLYTALTVPLWRQAVYDLLVSRRSIRFFLEKTFGSKAIDEGLMDYDYVTAHQPGAANAPYAFVSGRLFSRDIRSVYERLEHRIWVPHATRGDFRDFSGKGDLGSRTNWVWQPFDTGALPHFERPAEFMEAYERFLALVPERLPG